MNKADHAQLTHRLRPLAVQIANIVARGVVHRTNDGKKQQLLQIEALEDEIIPDAEHFHPYGFSSVPLDGAEVVVVFPGGDRGHPLIVATSDRRHRPVGGQPGEVTIYNNAGAKIVLKSDGTVVVNGAVTVGPTSEGVVVGTGIDPFTGQTYNVLGSASSNLFAKK